ncbi:hypothetical protein AMATHDRAFT_6 [Amanita thiersii Skay4041]|uniref:Uncharacterized protein n=1 Tax=Amanita thiersii Skay4041 TaxID=703135 RepID=A0A2A9P187_9AGAR|nr:hypothetical protein AMATHDRAFT_6 [Amanita thiersii Skay4041]
MFVRSAFLVSLALLLVGQVLSSPAMMKRIPAPAPIEPLVRRLDTILMYKKRQQEIPVEQAVKSPNGVIQPYPKRQIPVEQAVKAPNGQIVPYPKRQIPAEQAVKSPNGQVVPYPKRQIPAEQAVKAPNGQIQPYPKRQIPVEQAVKAPNGQIVPYPKRQIPAEQAVKSPNGQIQPYPKREFIPAEEAVAAPDGIIRRSTLTLACHRMTEYDYSPEAYERYISTQRRIARWVDQTERHRPEFSTGNDVTPPVPPTVYGDGEDGYFSGGGTGRRPSKSRDRRHTLSLASHPVYPYSAHYGAPVPPPYPYPPNSAGLMVPGPMPVSAGYTSFSQAVPPPPLMIISPAASHQSHKSRRSQKSRHSQTYMLASAPVTGGGGYYQYPYGTSTGYVYMGSSRQVRTSLFALA